MKKYSIAVLLVLGFISSLFSQTNDPTDSIKNQKVKSNLDSGKSTQTKGNIIIENRGAILVARIDGGPHALLDQEIAKQLKALVDKVDKDPNIRAVVFTLYSSRSVLEPFRCYLATTGWCRIPSYQYRHC